MEEPLNRLKGGLETLHELSIGSSSVPKEAVGFIADSLEGPISWIDRLFWEVYRRQPVVRPAEEVQGLSSVGDLRSVAEEEDKAKDNPPLNPATRERLVALLNEITDMNIALGRLIKSGDLQDYPLALKELSRAMDSRLAITFSILCTGKEEDQGLQERMRTPSGSELKREGRQVGGRPIGVDHLG